MADDYSDSAMIALVPAEADAKRLAIDGYEEPAQLHVTLAFLGDPANVADWTAVEAGCRRLAASLDPLNLETWATSEFNPTGDKPCAVYLIGGNKENYDAEKLDGLHTQVMELCLNEIPDMPEQHVPFVPHLTAAYGDVDIDILTEAGQPVVFDRLRLAIGEDNIDIPLQQSVAASGGLLMRDVDSRLGRLEAVVGGPISSIKRMWDELLHPRGRDGRFIEKNGWVTGKADVGGGESVDVHRGRVKNIVANPQNAQDPIIEIEIGDGRVGRALASTVQTTAGPKASLLDRVLRREPVDTGADLPDVADTGENTLSANSVATSQFITTQYTQADSVEEALTLLAAGKKVKLRHRDEVNILLDRMVEIAQEAREQGVEAPKYNICDVTIEDKSLFCENSKGIPRLNMPQLGGTPIPGSKSDALSKDEKGRVDLTEQFREHLESRGYAVDYTTKQASHLKASQNELDGPTVGRIAAGLAERPMTDPLFISRDDYVVDGHHRWAASFVDSEDSQIPVAQVDMDIIDLLAEAVHFTQEWGIASQDIGSQKRETVNDLPDWDPRSDAEFMARYPDWDVDSARIEAGQQRALDAGLDTQAMHDQIDGVENKYTAERAALHAQLIERFLNRPDVKREKKALFISGLPGSGKTTLLNSEIGQEKLDINLDEYVIVNPDEVKLVMAEMGMYPDFSELDLHTEGEAATLVHEESSYLSKLIRSRAMADGMNTVVDTSGKKPGQFLNLQEDIGDFETTDWDVSLVLADVSPTVAMQRAIKRYYDGEQRYTPLGFIASMRNDDGTTQPVDSFHETKHLANRAYLFDNTNGPRLVEELSKESTGTPEAIAAENARQAEADKGVNRAADAIRKQFREGNEPTPIGDDGLGGSRRERQEALRERVHGV